MKKLLYLICAALPLGAVAQEDNQEKITRVEITIEKDGETKTITRELKDGDFEGDVQVFRMNGDEEAFAELIKAKRFLHDEHNAFFFDESFEGEEKEVAFLGVTGHTQAIGDKQVVMLDKIIADEPAARAGLQPGDIVRSMDGKDVATWEALVEEIHGQEPGNSVNLNVERMGKSKTYEVVLGKRTMKEGGKMRVKYEVEGDDVLKSRMRFFFTDEVSDMEKSIVRKNTGVVLNEKNEIKDADLDMYPNPTPGKFDFELKLKEGGKVEVSLFDTAGNQIEKLSQESEDGVYKGSFDISERPAGPYMIVFKKEGKAMVEKVLKF